MINPLSRELKSKTSTVARVSPCGFFSIYVRKNAEKTKADTSEYGADGWDAKVSRVQQENPGIGRIEASEIVLHSVQDVRARLEDGGDELRRELDLTRATNSRIPPSSRSPRGMKGLSSYSRRLLLNSCQYLEERYGKDQLSFLTLTLPRVSDEALTAIQENWSAIVHRLTDSLTSLLKRSGLPGQLVGAVEIQPQRFIRSGQSVPHLHVVFVGRALKSNWKISPAKIKAIWKNCIFQNTGVELNMSGAVDLKRVQKSASRYLAKYLSKGSTTVTAALDGSGELQFVSCWYVCSLSLRRLYRRSITVSAVAAVQIVEWINDGIVKNWKKVVIELPDGGTFVPCISGYLPLELAKLLTVSMLQLSKE